MTSLLTYLDHFDVGIAVLPDVRAVDLVVLEPLQVGMEVAEDDFTRQHSRVAHRHCLVLGAFDDGLV